VVLVSAGTWKRWYRLLDDALDMFFAHIDTRKKGRKR
jgi:hypothetical protein